ncbi:MAG: flagellar hook-length control protein FliK [Campylobacterales bacterium]|nr:flagellar hook-length control protein FliK [Campylobacterales bacterium]MBN2831929.1 flagellar hook-length control protein FliK [Campylobacterales bacterium]
MEISTASLLANQLQTLDPKANAKENATKIIQEHTKELPFLTSPQKSIPNNAQEVIGTLLGAAVSEAKSKSAIFEILQNHQLFKNMGNFAEDIKTLPSLIKPDAMTTKPLALLELFAKNIQTIDGKVLAQQVNHSGIFFESKLAQEATQKGVEALLKELTINIQTLLKETTQANVSIPRDIALLLEQLSQTPSLSTKESQEGLKQLLELFRQNIKQEQALVTSSSFKEVYTNVQKLDYALKQMDLIGSKVQNYPSSMEVEHNFTTQVKVLLELVKEHLPALNLKELQPQVDQLLAKESLLKGALDPLTLTKEVASPITLDGKEGVPQTLVTPSSLMPSASQLPQTVEEALQMVVNRLKAQIELMEPATIKHANFLDKAKVLEKEIHALIKPELFVGKAMAQKLALDPSDVELLSDMKGVLTKLNHTLSLSGQNKEALEITNRLLTQIEYHQLVSYVSSSTHLYIPFSWNGLKGGSMMMKKSSDEQFHCQLDLDLEAYGKLNMMLILSNEKYIDMTIATQKKELNGKLTQHLSLLKRAFNEVGLITGNVKMLEYKDVERVKKDYFKGEELQFGINITI